MHNAKPMPDSSFLEITQRIQSARQRACRAVNTELVAIELKACRFEPEHLGKLNFYLEALERDHCIRLL